MEPMQIVAMRVGCTSQTMEEAGLDSAKSSFRASGNSVESTRSGFAGASDNFL